MADRRDAHASKHLEALGQPLNIREVAERLGYSPWVVRHVLIRQGLPHFRSGASGKLMFYSNQVVRWILNHQNKGGKKR
jgi:hypothetical protein